MKSEKRTIPYKSTYSTDGVLLYSLMGGIIGDIAGSSREGYKRNTAKARKLLTQKSRFTDDTALMIAVAEWVHNQEKATLESTLLKWYNRYPRAGYGSRFKSFIETGVAHTSDGNGGAMRVAPVALYANSLEETLRLAEQQCKVTHASESAVVGAKAIASATFISKEGRKSGKSAAEVKSEVKSYIEQQFGYNLDRSLEEIQADIAERSRQRELEKRTGVEISLSVRTSSAALSCPMAITAFLLGESFEESIWYAIAMGGDSDTIACMAGSISAQLYGVPQQFVDEALLYLPLDIVEVLNAVESDYHFTPSRVAPPAIDRWNPNAEVVVYGKGDNDDEEGGTEVVPSRFVRFVVKGYPIPTIGKSLDEIKASVATFIDYAKHHPELRFHIRRVGYHKAGYTVEQIAPLFSEAKSISNILLPKEIITILKW